ncbi:MAG: aspartyl protease family protein, partial [Betaproteobacteria bacterium]|nr:aspartyl protease family protein [Betaproteobacteria bacterium]
MIDKLFLLFGIVGLGLAPDPQAEPESGLVETSPQPTEVVEGDRDIYNRMTVPVTINGQGPFNFMVDTGAQATVVTHRLNERMNFRPLGSATLVGMASTAQVQVVEVDGLEFAARVFDNLEAPLLDSRDLGADGILGLDSLQDMRVILDFRDNHIEVADSSVLQGNRGYEIIVRARSRLGRLIITSAKIDGVTTAVILDTGAQASMGNLALRDKLRARRQAETITTDVNGEQIRGDLHFVRKLDLGRVSLANLSVSFADGPAFAALGLDKKPALILGMEDLRLFDRVA